MSTDSESQGSRNSATYSIRSLDDVPIRRSAVQIIRERSTDLIPPGSPRKKGVMQITKLVLKDPPTSPKRKQTPMVIRSIQTFTSSAVIKENGQILHDHRTIHEQKEESTKIKTNLEEGYRIIPLPQVNSGQLKEEFDAKKNERNQASSEFQNYLLESFNKENKPKVGIEISKATSDVSANSNQPSVSEKCKSDSSASSGGSDSANQKTVSPPSSGGAAKAEIKPADAKLTVMPEEADEPAVKPTAPRRASRPKTAESKKTLPEHKKEKEKSYDPQKAREFIKEQQSKRKLEKKTSGHQMSEKEMIKKRLEDLKKNTQVLVSKNVQKARKRSLSASGTGSQKSGAAPVRAGERSKSPPMKPLRKSSSISSLRPVVNQEIVKPDSGKSSTSSRDSKQRSSLLKANLNEKMGIMRKPDGVALEEVMMSPLRIKTPPQQAIVTSPRNLLEPNGEVMRQNDHEKNVPTLEEELKLEIPEVRLVPDTTVKPSRQESPPAEKKEFKPVPPWLKHTLLQPDPYPFIMAVRKKLEAIRNLNANSVGHPNESIIPKKPEESTKHSTAANSQKCIDYLDTLKSVPYINKPPSEIDQNISSVSLQQSDSNTTSEISSIKSDFVLPLPPLSSTKFDTQHPAMGEYHRPELTGPISPLSVDRISNLKITANGSPLEKSVNFNRGDHMPYADCIPDRASFNNRHAYSDNIHQRELSLNTSEKQRKFLQKPGEITNKDLEYHRMLEAFNRSLTQVIEVNQQLYSALQKPVDPVSSDRVKIRDEMTQTTPVPSVAANASVENYSEDFERSDDLKPSSTQPPPDSTQSTPEKSSTSVTTTTSSSTPLSSTTAPQSSTSPEESPSGKTQSSGGSQSQLIDSRSLSLSDSHNTNLPMPEEYLPSFEESLRQRQQLSVQEAGPSLTSIETQISDEAPVAEGLRNSLMDHSKSFESISMLLSEPSEALNDQSPKEVGQEEPEMEILKAASSSSAAEDDSELGAVGIEIATRECAAVGNDTTMGSDIMAVFNRTDMELSIMSTTISETNLSYSSIGLYDQLIQSEKCRGDQLASQARLKEKALLNRTKGQLAWLELQKQRYRERGMMEQISAIKKKQRAILMRLEKERAVLSKLKKFTPDVSSRSTAVRSPMTPKSMEKLNSFSSHNSNQISLRKSSSGSGRNDQHNSSFLASAAAKQNGDLMSQSQQRMVTRTTTTTISNGQMQLMTTTAAVRGMELEPSESLEDILQRREEELQKRRQHVQHLLEWHQKLDREEQEILSLEQNLLQHNQRKIAESQAADVETLSRIRSIETSLKTLKGIPDSEGNTGQGDGEDVQASGSKLNRLWYRLTGIKESRYEVGRSYTLTKASLETLYEDAKLRVLEGFKGGDRSMRRVLLEQTLSGMGSSGSTSRNVSGFSESKNVSSEQIPSSVGSSEGNSFQTTVNSAGVIQEIVLSADNSELADKTEESNEERSKLIDVEEIISRVSDITDNINGFLSSTTNIEALLQHEEQDKQQSTSVEFHTLEDEQDSDNQPKLSTDTYTVPFDIPTIEKNRVPLPSEDNQLMIEDISLPPMMNDDSLLNDESISESIVESSEKVSEEIPDNISLDEASSLASTATTPTTAEETETECTDVLTGNVSASNAITSELEKRLIILNENLGELSESFERVSVSRSPETTPKADRLHSPETDSGASPIVEEEYSTDMDFAVEDHTMERKSFLQDEQTSQVDDSATTADVVEIENHKIEIKVRNKNMNESFPHTSTVGVPSTSGMSSFSYLPPSAHGASTAPQTTAVPNRMPDIINEAEVLRRQQLQIEQEIKQLEQQVVFFREIPYKPPPPYIPPANGSPLALIFPSESRIDELVETRTKELYFDEPPEDKLRAENVTNIYEKLILDMCKELFMDVRPPKQDVSFRTVKHEKRPLAFYNPPDRLTCVQNYMKRKIKRILNEDILLQQQQQTPHHCPMPFLMFAGSSAKRKRDQVDEILAQEMFDEEPRWTDFDREEIEVKERIVQEVTKLLVADALTDMEQAWKQKHSDEQKRDVSSDNDSGTLHEEKVEESN